MQLSPSLQIWSLQAKTSDATSVVLSVLEKAVQSSIKDDSCLFYELEWCSTQQVD